MSGLGGIAPQERDLSRRRDRQASVVLTIAAAVSMLIFFPLVLVLVLGLVAMVYSYVAGPRAAFWVAVAIVVIGLLSLLVGLTDFDGGAFQG
jgi:4-hydroxybenzoate polyprenyltransferase